MSEKATVKHPKPTLTIDLPDSDFESVLICAVRYACGRATYMPGLVQNWIIDHCPGKLSKGTLETIARDITEQIDYSERIGSTHGSPILFENDLMFQLLAWCNKQIDALDEKEQNENDND